MNSPIDNLSETRLIERIQLKKISRHILEGVKIENTMIEKFSADNEEPLYGVFRKIFKYLFEKDTF